MQFHCCVCCSSTGNVQLERSMLVHSWRGNTHTNLSVLCGTFPIFFFLSLSFHSFFSLVAHDDASIKKWKAIIFPIREEKKKKKPPRIKRVYVTHCSIERETVSLSLAVKSTRPKSALPILYIHTVLSYSSRFISSRKEGGRLLSINYTCICTEMYNNISTRFCYCLSRDQKSGPEGSALLDSTEYVPTLSLFSNSHHHMSLDYTMLPDSKWTEVLVFPLNRDGPC